MKQFYVRTKKQLIIAILLVFSSVNIFAQTYILNEDFSTANGTTPPANWTNSMISGHANDVWHFDNPGARMLNYPIIGTFAIFDAANYSYGDSAEIASLETPYLDCSISSNILLIFDQFFAAGDSAIGQVEVWDGSVWNIVATYTDSSVIEEHLTLDISAYAAGITNVKVRFVWSGNDNNFWAIDNVNVYAPLTIDGAITKLDSPVMPFPSGTMNIKCTFQNLGIDTLTSTTINWSVNNVVQTPFSWTGNLSTGEEEDSITIGSYTFNSGVIDTIKIWHTYPNGTTDMNALNDQIESNLSASLCGIYTIGGLNPDFATFTDAAYVLNNAGITCPVTFNVRDGVYDEHISLSNIPGNSLTNTITFQGESGDSSLVTLQNNVYNNTFNFTLNLENLYGITFKNMKISRGSNSHCITISNCNNVKLSNSIIYNSNWAEAISMGSNNTNIEISNNNISSRIMLDNCSNNRNTFIKNNLISGSIKGQDWYSNNDSIFIKNLQIKNNIITTTNGSAIVFKKYPNQHIMDIQIISNKIVHNPTYNYTTIDINNSGHNTNDSITIKDNEITRSQQYAGHYIYANYVDSIIGNRMSGAENTTAIQIDNGPTFIANNYITIGGISTSKGISLSSNASNSTIVFNSINNIGNNPLGSVAMSIDGNPSNLTVKNNIFACTNGGLPLNIPIAQTAHNWDYNCYFSSNNNRLINYQDTIYSNISDWTSVIGFDTNSINFNPFYSSDTNLSINQTQLNNTAINIAVVDMDIDGTIRNSNPDMGATEYSICANDAGINVILSPENPLNNPNQDIIVELQNQGSNPLTSVAIAWSVNGTNQTTYNWTGSLNEKDTAIITIANHTFSGANIFDVKVWTELPNGTTDCNHLNDTAKVNNLFSRLCGTYTIGGYNPDFATFTDAANVLNSVGITCPVTFNVRDGVYDEHISLSNIPGNSLTNTITFQGESGDSSLVTLQYNTNTPNNSLDYTLSLESLYGITFKNMKISRGSNYNCITISNCNNVKLSNNIIYNNSWAEAISMGSNNTNIEISNNNISSRIISDNSFNNNNIFIKNNIIDGSIIGQDWNWNNDSIFIKNMQIKNNIITTTNGSAIAFKKYPNQHLMDIQIISNEIIHSSSINYPAISIDNIGHNTNDSIRIKDNNIISNRQYIYANYVDSIIGNRTSGAENTTAIQIDNGPTFIANNYITIGGTGTSKGISLSSNTSNSTVVYNSINNIGSNPMVAMAMSIEDTLSNLTVKNNIFACTNGGLPLNIPNTQPPHNWDYNCYYSTSGNIGTYNGTTYSTIASFGTALSSDANSVEIDPHYISSTDLMVAQKQLNGSGIDAGGVIYDIDGELRNLLAPDIGAQEFMVDFGVTQLVQPTLDCFHTSSDSIEVLLRQFGDVPFIDQQVAYQINGGIVHIELIPGTNYNDIYHKFATVEDLSALGSYHFKIWLVNNYDDNSNNDTLEITLYRNDVPQVDFTTPITCANVPTNFTGSATISNGSIASYEWLFGDGATSLAQNPSHTYDTSAVYSVTLRAYSNVGCYGDTTKDITLLITPQAEFNTNDVCFDEIVSFTNNTTIDSGSVTYLWNFGDGSTDTITAPSHIYTTSGKYPVSLLATASSGCTNEYIDSVFVNPEIISVVSSSNDTADIIVSGGTPFQTGSPYNYYWSNGATSSQVTGLTNGIYYVTISDSSSCSRIDSVEISIPNLSISLISTDVSFLGQNDGTVDMTINSGVGPFTIQWSNGATTEDINNLSPGMYSVEVKDVYQNLVRDTAYVHGYDTLILSSTHTNVLCNGTNTGSIDLTIDEGTPPYNIMWSNSSTSEDISNLYAGMYTVTVNDSNNNVAILNIEVTEPLAITSITTATDAKCYGDTGQITIFASGGTGTFEYSIDSINYQSSNIFTGLLANPYTIIIRDSSACAISTKDTILQPTLINATVTATDPYCHGDTGLLTVLAYGGTGTLEYSIDSINYQSSNIFTGLLANSYTVVIRDSNACTISKTTTVNEPSAITATSISTDALCNGGFGEIEVIASGGTGTINYSIDSIHYQSSNIFPNLIANPYTIIIRDDRFCHISIKDTVFEPFLITATVNITNASSIGGFGTITINAFGGTGTLEYSLDGINYQTSNVFSNVAPNYYTISIRDANGCIVIINATVSDPTSISENVNGIQFSLYPNPATDKIYVNYKLNKKSNVNIQLINMYGALIKNINIDNQSIQNTAIINVNNYAAGTYLLIFKYDNTQIFKKVIIKNRR